jgi:hypothetical protein
MSGRCSPTEALALLGPDFSPMAAAHEMMQAIQTNSSFRLWCDGVLIKPHIAAIAKVVPTLESDGRWIADIESTGPGLGWARGLPWELEIDDVMAVRPQPDTRAEAMQTAATAATAAAEAARAEAATARAELEQARAVLQAATEQLEKAQARAEAAEARADAIASETTTRSDPEPEPRRRPGPKFKDDWPMLVAAETIRLARYEPEMLENLAALVAHMHNFLKEEIGWMADNEKEIRDKLRLLLNIKRK